MVHKGDCINNPVTGERIEFLQTSEDTDGGLLQILRTVKHGGYVGASQIHPVQDVRFLVKSGSLHVKVDHRDLDLAVGEEYVVPHGVPYTWWNEGVEDLRIVMEFRPALQTEDMFISLYALARAGKTDEDGMPNLLQSAAMSRKYKYEVFMAKPSIRIQKLFLNVLSWFARLFGYHADYPHQRAVIVLESGQRDGELATVPVEIRCE